MIKTVSHCLDGFLQISDNNSSVFWLLLLLSFQSFATIEIRIDEISPDLIKKSQIP